jgi:glycosyltransferase involved in cell wall biosynthesis
MIPHWIDENINIDIIQKEQGMILFVGRIESNKGFEYLTLLKNNKNYTIHCVTSTPVQDNFVIHKNISDLELQNLYQRASLVIVPAKYEAFSYVTLEALLNGTPVLISDRVRILDHLNNVSGVTVFEYGNVDDFMEKINVAMKQKVDIKLLYKIFSKEKAYEEYKKIFTDMNV